MTNAQLADHVSRMFGTMTREVVRLRQQQERMEARLAFIAPAPADIRREVDDFISSALGESA
jgi:hypothetical protein